MIDIDYKETDTQGNEFIIRSLCKIKDADQFQFIVYPAEALTWYEGTRIGHWGPCPFYPLDVIVEISGIFLYKFVEQDKHDEFYERLIFDILAHFKQVYYMMVGKYGSSLYTEGETHTEALDNFAELFEMFSIKQSTSTRRYVLWPQDIPLRSWGD